MRLTRLSPISSSQFCKNFRLFKICDHCFTRRLFSGGGVSSRFNLYHKKSSVKNYKAVFLGSDNFSVPSLITVTNLLGPANVSVVVSNFGNAVGKYAKKNGLKAFHWDEYKATEFWKDNNTKNEADFGVVASFGYLIPLKVIERFPLGILNVHGSLLPRWRGAAPIPHAIMYGDKTTGISIMQIAPHRFDVGPILYRQEIPLHPHVRRPELMSILAEVGATALGHVISDLDHFLAHPIIQNEEEAKLSPKLIPEMALVDWSSKTAEEIYNLFRGLYGMFKLKTYFMEKTIDLDEIGLVMNKEMDNSFSLECDSLVKSTPVSISTNFEHFYSNSPIYHLKKASILPSSGVPGQIIFIKDSDILFVKCSEAVERSSTSQDLYAPYISVRRAKAGNKWMSAKDFQNGFLSKFKPDERVFSFKAQQLTQNQNLTVNKTRTTIGKDKINCSNS